MHEYLKNKNIRLRCRKNYPDAHTHIIIGTVVSENSNYILVRGRTFHFRRIENQLRSNIQCGDTMTRAVPWSNIEIIHELGHNVDYETDIAFDRNGNLILTDRNQTIIGLRRDGE